MKKSIIILFVAVMCLALVGCGKKKNSIVGVWKRGSFVYTFNKDGTCNYEVSSSKSSNMKCTYKTDGDKLTIQYVGDQQSFNTTYSFENGRLNIKDANGQDSFYERQK